MRSYAERFHDDWYILSAEYGLLDPNGDQIEPYERTLRNFSACERKSWSEDVVAELNTRGVLGAGTTLVIHAGKPYYKELLPLLEGRVREIQILTEGLQIDETLAWYSDRL